MNRNLREGVLALYPEPTVSAVILNPDSKFLLCRSHKWDDKWVIPGGHIERGEAMETALRREIYEETGLEIRDIRLIGIKECIGSGTFYREEHFIFIDYICRTDTTDVVLNDEAEEYAWVSFDRLDEYPLGGFTEALLLRLRPDYSGADSIQIYYNY